MSSQPSTWAPPATRFFCPVSRCDWTHDDPGPVLPAYAADPAALSLAHALEMESVIREHLETHPLIEWARELAKARSEKDAQARGVSLTVAVLLRRLGGHAEITDAELAAEQGTLTREPVPDGFRLTVTG